MKCFKVYYHIWGRDKLYSPGASSKYIMAEDLSDAEKKVEDIILKNRNTLGKKGFQLIAGGRAIQEHKMPSFEEWAGK